MARQKAATKATTAAKAVKAEEVKVEEVKVEEVKVEAVEEEKATEEKKTVAAKKTAEKKSEFFVQFSGLEFSYDDLLEKVKADYMAQTGKKTISSTKLYLKPEDMTVYYVVNEKFLGHVYLG